MQAAGGGGRANAPRESIGTYTICHGSINSTVLQLYHRPEFPSFPSSKTKQKKQDALYALGAYYFYIDVNVNRLPGHVCAHLSTGLLHGGVNVVYKTSCVINTPISPRAPPRPLPAPPRRSPTPPRNAGAESDRL